MAPKRRLQDSPLASAASSSAEGEVEVSDNDAVEEEANGVSCGMELEDDRSEGDAEDESEEGSETESDKTRPTPSEIFELSKKVWESAAANGVDQRNPVQSKVKNVSNLGSPKSEMAEYQDEPHCEVNSMPAKSCSKSSVLDGFLVSGKLSLTESAMAIVNEAMPLIGSSKANELERRVKELQKDEFLLYLKRVELIHDSAKLALDSIKSSM